MSWKNGLRLVTTGLPRLYAAARDAGCSQGQAFDALRISGEAFRRAAQAEPTRLRVQNALRHFCWQALLTARHGLEVAQALAQAQEHGSSDADDSAVDAVNNTLGQDYGVAHRAELTALSLSAALDHVLAAGRDKWESRELASVPLEDGSDPRDVSAELDESRAARRRRSRSRRPR